MFLFSKLINNKNKKLMIHGWILYFLDLAYISSFNVARQGIANFLYLLILKNKKQKHLSIVILLVAYGIHKSIILIIPFIWILEFTYSKKKFIFLLIVSIFIGHVFDFSTFFINNILPNIFYYGEIYNSNEMSKILLREGLGFGYYYRIFLSTLLILFYDKLKLENKKELVFINATIFWAILKILTSRVWIIERFLDYLYYSNLISFPILFSKINSYKNGKYVTKILFLLFFIMFLRTTIFSDLSQKLMPYKSIFK
jgi:hypothetical protein